MLDEFRAARPASVCHLQAVLGPPQVYVSQQLGELREAEGVADRREGRFVFCRLADPLVEQPKEQTLGPPRKAPVVFGRPCPRCETESA